MKGFSDEERDRIRAALMDAGRDLFARYGLRKTTIADLTDPVGIGTSTFYQFFDSKEALYAEILEAEEEAIAERIMATSFESEDDPRAAIEAFLHAIFEEIETNPLIRTLMVEDELDRLEAQYSAEEQAQSRREELAFIVPHVERWQAEGRLREAEAETIAGAIRAMPLLTLHQDDIGENYAAVRDLLIESVAAGLVAE
ncbi:TetR/AcrR family transcriptional regulator [Haloarcula marina]|uniref:TetR/AcrR family transcriptional regulator n=1 Tax=Haloarcula marina TaxID=2961574 RepID=UPI0020B6533D|nr:TetR/AcrR family transcriptional regulator [Halomicroarcula marina]